MDPQTQTPVVNAFNEWDPLEEIVVGRVDDTTLVPPWDVIMPAVVHDKTQWDFFKAHGGTPWPVEMLKKAERDLDAFIDVLQQAGVTVRQPEPYAVRAAARHARLGGREQLLRADASRRAVRHRRPDHRGADGLAQPVDRAARVPRALQGVLPRRRPLGRRAAARVSRTRATRRGSWRPEEDEPQRFLPTEYEPMFDAADAIKCGRDVFIARSSCCNRFGIEWLQRHLGDEYTVHEIEVHDTHPMHIDATFQPLAPGKLLINPERVVKVPDMFEKAGWDVLVCPEPEMPESHPMYNCSRWIMMNVVMLDETRVVVSAGEKRFVAAAEGVGLRADRVPLLGLRDHRRRVPLRQRRHPPPRRPQVVLLSRARRALVPGACPGCGYGSLNANPMVDGGAWADTLSGAKGTLWEDDGDTRGERTGSGWGARQV